MKQILGLMLIDDNNTYEFYTNRLYKVNENKVSRFKHYRDNLLFFEDYKMDKDDVYSVLEF